MQDKCKDIVLTGGVTFTVQMGWYPVIMCRSSLPGENWQGRVNSIYTELPETEATSSLWGSRKLEQSGAELRAW